MHPPQARKLKKYMYRSRKFFISTNKTHKLFDALDDNHDGAISLHEFLHCLHIAEKENSGTNNEDAEELTTDEKIQHIFRFYCSYGERFQDNMSGPNWSKCIRDVDLKVPKENMEDKFIDERNLTLADLGIVFKAAHRYQAAYSPSKKNRMTYDTFLYALRQLATKRFPDMPPVHALKTVLVRFILPLYDDEISSNQNVFAKSEKEQHHDKAEYQSNFRPQIESFFKQHAKGLRSIFSRYCNLNFSHGDDGKASHHDHKIRAGGSAVWDDIRDEEKKKDSLEVRRKHLRQFFWDDGACRS